MEEMEETEVEVEVWGPGGRRSACEDSGKFDIFGSVCSNPRRAKGCEDSGEGFEMVST